ncbi:MAG: ribosome-recycling factor [Candidatus Colwellbacteria bacterium]|nr:ribosome-recycling factor [Candidatus Colwellbacteria bacterium]
MDPLKEMDGRMKEILSFVKEEFSKIRSNRPTTKLVEHVKVDYMGSEMQISHIASLSINPPKDIIISPWDKNAIPAITKAIESTNLGLGISADSTGVRLTMPELTAERKNELGKLIKSIAEENRIKMRSHRDKAIKSLNELPEDQKFRGKEELQKMVDRFNGDIDSAVTAKLSEING